MKYCNSISSSSDNNGQSDYYTEYKRGIIISIPLTFASHLLNHNRWGGAPSQPVQTSTVTKLASQLAGLSPYYLVAWSSEP